LTDRDAHCGHCRVFLDSLIEEPDVGLQQAGLKVGNGVVQFLESVQLDVHQLLKE
jgi:hypothetical protein